MLGVPALRMRDYSDKVAMASSIASALAFTASIMLLASRQYWLALASWLVSGASASATVMVAYSLYESARRLATRVIGEENVPRELIGAWLSAALSIPAPPAAGMLMLAALENLIDVVDAVYAKSSVNPKEVTGKYKGILGEVNAMAGLAALPLLLPLIARPLLVTQLRLWCLLLDIVKSIDEWFRDKPCRGDLIDVMVWAEPLNTPSYLDAIAEKWSVKD